MKKILLVYGMFVLITNSIAQNVQNRTSLVISGYGELYYTYDFACPENHIRQNFLYNYNRHNTIAVNLGMIKAAYDEGPVRSNLALMWGTYANDNTVPEKESFKNLYEANIGIKLSKQRNLWLDAGVIPSHIGWESAIGKDNYTLTRSLAAENSPYYETGIKMSYTTRNKKLLLSGMILNGWQRIEKADGNNSFSFGHQITYKPNSKITINSSSFIGNDKPDNKPRMRYFHDLYGIFTIRKNLSLICGVDIGAEEKLNKSSGHNFWSASALILRLQSGKNACIALRGESFIDKNGVIIVPVSSVESVQLLGYSVNFDYSIQKNVMWRVEFRGFAGKEKMFINNNTVVNNNLSIMSSLSISF